MIPPPHPSPIEYADHASGASRDSTRTCRPCRTTACTADTYWDDKGFVTYWQSDMADALTY